MRFLENFLNEIFINFELKVTLLVLKAHVKLFQTLLVTAF